MLSTAKLVGAAILAVAVFYVGGMATMQALHAYGNFEWAIMTASFWLGGLITVAIAAECVKRTVQVIALVIEEEEPAPHPAAPEEAEDEPLARPAHRPAPALHRK